MKEYIRDIIKNIENSQRAGLVIREYLQARILESLQNSNAFSQWAFLGGTALRFLYSIPRFSEDLDFSVIRDETENRNFDPASDFTANLKNVKRQLERELYKVEIIAKTEHTVKSAFIKFPELLFELGLSHHEQEKISIKIELDTNPPEGAKTETTLVRRHTFLNINHYDRSSLFAGKLNAIITRGFTKGRDIYDLIWYLSDPSWPEPNMKLLNNAVHQFFPTRSELSPSNWKDEVYNMTKSLDWKVVRNDVSPFLEHKHEVNILSLENIEKLLVRR